MCLLSNQSSPNHDRADCTSYMQATRLNSVTVPPNTSVSLSTGDSLRFGFSEADAATGRFMICAASSNAVLRVPSRRHRESATDTNELRQHLLPECAAKATAAPLLRIVYRPIVLCLTGVLKDKCSAMATAAGARGKLCARRHPLPIRL